MEINKIYEGNNLETLKNFDDNSIDCCVTSPPYYGLRDYGTGKWVGGDPNCPHYRTSHYSEKTITGHKAMYENAGAMGAVADGIYKHVCKKCGAVRVDEQVGLEETPEEYIQKLVDIFAEVKRILKDDGTLWLNIGDSYAGGAGRWGGTDEMSDMQKGNQGSVTQIGTAKKWQHATIKPKDLIGIPWMLAFALRENGWYLRQDIIWAKPNPMPESIKDRCTKSHEYVFLLTKNAHYHFDYESIQEISNTDVTERRHKRDVWTVIPSTYKGAHFATFPEDLIAPMILAGCPENGIVLDPFMGSGTVGLVAKKHNRNYVGCELNADYIKLAETRISNATRPLF